jgi:methionyl-tRNA synthetase
VPAPGKYSEADKKILAALEKAPGKIAKLMYDVKLREALAEAVAVARLGNQYMTAEEPWKNEERRPTVIYVSLNVCAALSVLLEPFLPETAGRIRKTLKLPAKLAWSEASRLLEPGTEIGAFEPLFRKVEPKEIAGHKKKFAGSHEHAKKGGKPMVKYEDFDKLEIKIGVVEAAERIAGKTKLLKLLVDTGEKRTLVAGIGEQYAPEDLLGKHLVVLTNLEPKKIGGIESQGMLLAAEDGGKIAVLSPDREVKQGSQVK